MNFKQKEGAAQSTVKPNQTGIPTQMKQQYEQLSHFSFDDVRVHYNSDKPAQLQALAYTQGSHVYIGPGQEQHLGHELGHVVQQKQGLVRQTTVVAGLPSNDNRQLESQADNLHSFAESLALLPVNPQVGNIVQRHEADPYTRQAEPEPKAGMTAHHIIPRELLDGSYDTLNSLIGVLRQEVDTQIGGNFSKDKVERLAAVAERCDDAKKEAGNLLDEQQDNMIKYSDNAVSDLTWLIQGNHQWRLLLQRPVYADDKKNEQLIDRHIQKIDERAKFIGALPAAERKLVMELEGRIHVQVSNLLYWMKEKAGILNPIEQQELQRWTASLEEAQDLQVEINLAATPEDWSILEDKHPEADALRQWPRGNIFFGPLSNKRIEPGRKDSFDSDFLFVEESHRQAEIILELESASEEVASLMEDFIGKRTSADALKDISERYKTLKPLYDDMTKLYEEYKRIKELPILYRDLGSLQNELEETEKREAEAKQKMKSLMVWEGKLKQKEQDHNANKQNTAEQREILEEQQEMMKSELEYYQGEIKSINKKMNELKKKMLIKYENPRLLGELLLRFYKAATPEKAIPYEGYEWRTVEAGEENNVLKDRSEAFAGSGKKNKEQENKERIKGKMVPSLYSPKILPS